MTDTLAKLTESIAASTESYPIHHAVAAYADTRVGKPITKKDAAALEAAHPGWLFRVHTDTSLSWNRCKSITFWQDQKWDNTRSEVRISRGPDYTRWSDSATIKADTNNARYFEHADARNAERAALISADTGRREGLKKAATLIDQLALIHAELKGTIEAYDLDSEASHKIREILKEKTEEDFKLY